MTWPNLRERRVWALDLQLRAAGHLARARCSRFWRIYLTQGLHLTQADVNNVVWIPPLTWGIGYFFWGWAADRFAANNPRPIGMFLLLTAVSLTLGFTTWTTSRAVAIALDLALHVHRRRIPDGRAEGRARTRSRASSRR